MTNKFRLAGDKFMSETHLRRTDLPVVYKDHLQKQRKKYKNLQKQEIQDKSIKRN